MVDYIDTSAFVKLIRSEPESGVLRAELDPATPLVSSSLLTVEGRRAAGRYGATALTRARAALATITLIAIDDATLEHAAELQPPGLRSLAALHLATALSLGEELRRLYCYDARLGDTATALGVDVRAPR